ncbi:hypothetical protein D3C81_2323050 [compost metagenome]
MQHNGEAGFEENLPGAVPGQTGADAGGGAAAAVSDDRRGREPQHGAGLSGGGGGAVFPVLHPEVYDKKA